MMMAGASAVGIGTGVYNRGVKAFSLIAEEMRAWMAANGFSKPRDLVGLAHERKNKE
jgi:dihydroorotate dehydrogenase (NAD+) catalytic subunit